MTPAITGLDSGSRLCQRELEDGEICQNVATAYHVMVDAATRIAYQVRLCEAHSKENDGAQIQ